jgi:lipopolysaccharide transport system ATP-binding protein
MIVDEALSVGDAKFQAKCFRRFEDLKARGTTILLVSHSMPSIVGFCDRAILLENGRLLEDGHPRDIDKTYQRLLFHDAFEGEAASESTDVTSAAAQITPESPPAPSIETTDYAPMLAALPPQDDQSASRDSFGSGEARITSAMVVDEHGLPTTLIETGKPFGVVLGVEAMVDVPDLVVGILLRTPRGLDVFGVDFQTHSDTTFPMAAGEKIVVRLQGIAWLASNDYLVTVGLAHADKRKMDLRYDYLHFRVAGTEHLYTASLVNLEHTLHVENMTLEKWAQKQKRDRSADIASLPLSTK